MAARLLVAALACIGALPAQSNFLSHTSESLATSTSLQICPDSPHDMQSIHNFNLTSYIRRPEGHTRHRRSLGDFAKEKHPQDLNQTHQGLQLDTIYAASLLVSSSSIQNSVSTIGDTRRLERVLLKLLTGQSVVVVALGGSVTVGHGPENRRLGWVQRVFSWIQETFPHPEHRLLNKAIPAVSSSYVAPCVLDMLPSNVDLVMLEFSFNDAERAESREMEDPTRSGFERLLRKVMNMESKPAVINMHYHPLKYQHLWDGAEDLIEMLLKYYAVPSLSTRMLFGNLLHEFPWLRPKLWPESDLLHPTCIGYKYMADIMIGFLQDMAAFVLLTHGTPETLPDAGLLKDQLPTPLLKVKTADSVEKCIMDEDFKTLVKGNHGWEWMDEGKTQDRHKWGFVTWTPGNAIVLKVPVQDFVPFLGQDRRLLVALGVLVSYEHMGWVHVTCVNGCSCARRDINAHNPNRYSMTYWKALAVTLDKWSNQCDLYVVNGDKSFSGEHKAKLTSLMVSTEMDSFIESWKIEEDVNLS